MLLSLFRMTCSALNTCKILSVGELLSRQIGMAADAWKRAVHRAGELLLVHVHGYRPAAALADLRLVGMAHQTVGILLGKEQRCPHKGAYQ